MGLGGQADTGKLGLVSDLRDKESQECGKKKFQVHGHWL
jgi:hypothetical protein